MADDARRLQGRQIVCVGFADWDTDLWTNQHHLMSRLARENHVLFVESLGLRRPTLAGRDLRRIVRRLRAGLRGPRPRDGLHVLSPLVLPFHSSRWARRLNRRILRLLVARAARRLGMREPILWAYVPQAEALLDALRPGLVVYHCVDDIAAQPGVDAASFQAAERRFAARADLVLASAPRLAERLRRTSENVLFAPNVADTDLFAQALEEGRQDPEVAALAPPRIVFTGAIVTTKLDIALIVELARARRQWSFALVGPIGPGDPHADVSALLAEPNVHLLGGRPYEDLPAVLRAADAALIPYAINPLTSSVFPMKVYEYLAAGLPVLATPLPALEGVEGIVTAADAAAMAPFLDRALAEDGEERRHARSRLARSHSWGARLAEIATAVEAVEQRRSVAAAGPAGGHQAEERFDLLVSTYTPARGSGRAMRTYGIARALARNRRLKLLYVPFGDATPDPGFAEQGVELIEVRPSRGGRRMLAYARARLAGVPRDFARGVSPELLAAAAELSAHPLCVRVIADGPVAAAALRSLAGRRPVVYNAHNLESSFRHELAGDGGLRGLAAFERGLLERACESWMVSEPDVEAARTLCPQARLRLVPNVIDTGAIVPLQAPAQEPRALFVANFSYEPNRNALGFLLAEVMPKVWAQLPEARLSLVGAGLDAATLGPEVAGALGDARVEVLGFVADLASAYRRSRAAVVPLLQGGGTPLKLLEALAYGLPAVTTSRAAAALGLRDGTDCRVADGARQFADALSELLRDGAPELGTAGRRLAEQRYSVEALAGILQAG